MPAKSCFAALLALSLVATKPATAAQPVYGSFGIDLGARATDILPGDDFWSYANGGWARRIRIASDSDAAGVSVAMRQTVEADVRQIIEDMASKPSLDCGERQVGALYRSWMDEAGIEARGNAVLSPWLARIAAIQDTVGLQATMALPYLASPIELGIDTDPDNPAAYVLTIGQGSLGMPRDFYVGDGEHDRRVRAAYRSHVLAMHQLAGISDAEARTDAIIALETAMARLHWSRAQSRESDGASGIERRADLAQVLPGFDWDRLLADYGLAPDARVLVLQKSAVAALGALLHTVPLQTWKDYLGYRFVADHAAYLPKRLADASFAFHGGTLSGMQVQPERWRRGIRLVNGTLDAAVGRIYAARHYSAAADRQARELVADVQAAFRVRIAGARWMDAATRRRALAKLDALKLLIGRPDHYPDQAALDIAPDDLLGNMLRAREFARRIEAERLHRPVDRALWVTTPQQMNAYYDQHANAIVFPAAILQPPLFDPDADAAVNYGAIGVLIGHEIGHAFDDQGRQFGPDGRTEAWWSASAAQAFRRRADALATQYDGYRVFPGVPVNGRLTLGENMADLSGIEAAYAAYQAYQARHGKAKRIAGLSGEQRFFLAYAQGRRTVIKEEALRQLVLVDTHAPPVFRINGALRNVDAWYTAFGVKPGNALYLPPSKRIHFW
jgi:endothelin-converting enzyme/putative endopeptidase